MFCKKCGYELPDDSFFCNKCGSKVEEMKANTNNSQSEAINELSLNKNEEEDKKPINAKRSIVV